MPELFPAHHRVGAVLELGAALQPTLLVSGVPAALYERLVERDPEAAASMWIWLGGAATLCLPAVLRLL